MFSKWHFAGKTKKIKREDVEKITGAPKGVLVNDVISAISEKNLEKGIGAVRKAAGENLDMKLFLKLIIQKLRVALILRYAPNLEEEMAEDLGETDLEFLRTLKKSEKISSKSLITFLKAYQNIDNAFITELPLELALVEILGE